MSLASPPRGPSNQEGSGCPNHLCRSDSIACRRWRESGEGVRERAKGRGRDRERGRDGGRGTEKERQISWQSQFTIEKFILRNLLSIHSIEDGVVECQFIEAGQHPVPPVRTTNQANHEHLQAINNYYQFIVSLFSGSSLRHPVQNCVWKVFLLK